MLLSSASQFTASKSGGQKVLILGSGYVSAPVVDYLTRNKTTHVTVGIEQDTKIYDVIVATACTLLFSSAASMVQKEIDGLATRYPNTTPALLDFTRDADDIEKLVADSDLTISLLPYSFHPRVAAMCIRNKRNMVTASYRSPEILKLHDEYIQDFVLFLSSITSMCVADF